MRIPCTWEDDYNHRQAGLMLHIAFNNGAPYAFIAKANGEIIYTSYRHVKINMKQCFSKSLTVAVKK